MRFTDGHKLVRLFHRKATNDVLYLRHKGYHDQRFWTWWVARKYNGGAELAFLYDGTKRLEIFGRPIQGKDKGRMTTVICKLDTESTNADIIRKHVRQAVWNFHLGKEPVQ